ncbi:EAL domain-containing protein [Silvimonas sp.]|uniref:bifunctional diguanylate cyclase/phosphodiesterase n=1 Tax=Silvimonas sp. TaxID=2650811 RepID=UPI00284580B5|nr:EAL domain-containing protein [Silvimonas sp.]MDR3426161.1 EAL domain-containing protein [Silvimonas sp.]
MPLPRSSFVVRLAAGVVLVNTFVYVLIASALYQSHAQYEQQATSWTQNLAQSLAINVAGTLNKLDIVIYSVAVETERQLAAGGIDPQLLSSYTIAQRKRIPETEGIRISDAMGNVLYGEKVPPGPARNIADRLLFQQLKAQPNQNSILSEPVISRVTGEWSVAMGRRVNRPDGSFAGIVFALIPLSWFTDLFTQLDIGKQGVIALRDAQLRIWVRVPAYSGKNSGPGNAVVSQKTIDMVKQHPAGFSYETVVKLDGIKRRMAFRKIEGQSLYFFVGQADADYLASWYKELALGLAVALAFTLISCAAAFSAWRVRRSDMRHIQALSNSKDQLQRSQTRFRALHDATSDAVWLRDSENMIDCNPAAVRLMGANSREQLLASKPTDLWPLLQEDGQNSLEKQQNTVANALKAGNVHFEWLYQRLDNQKLFPAEVLLTALVLDDKPILQVVIRDITERKQAEEQIRQLAYFDTLTGLPNRRLLMERLSQALQTSQQSGQFGALMILDLDNFKVLNDTRGHEFGDRLLIAVAQRIKNRLRTTDTICRLGGDEYVVILERLGLDRALAASLAEDYAEEIRSLLDQPYLILDDGLQQHSTSSIGVTLFFGEETPEHTLLKHADVALYQAKAAGRNAVRFFSPAMQDVIDSRSNLEVALRNGLQRSEFKLYYQPQFSLDTGLIGAEALLRWFPTQYKPVSPALFIPVAEESGLILRLGSWVLQSACGQLKVWEAKAETRDLKMAVNVSARQFHQPDFVAQVRGALQSTGANPARLQLELTESVVLEQVEDVVARMQQIRQLGVTFSLDDFGTGFSSLSYLKQLPLDQIKIDRSFVRDVPESANDVAIVRAMIAISQSLGLQVIAEGVESQAQLEFLTAMGCRTYQGFLLGHPMPIEDWGRAVAEVPAPGR